MALKVRDAQPFGDLVVGAAPQPKLTVSNAPQQQLVVGNAGPRPQLSVSRAPMRMPTISGVQGAAPAPAVMRTDPMNDPLKWWGEQASGYGKGVWEILQDIMAAPERILRSTAGLAFKPQDQNLLTSDRIAGIPGTEAAARILYGKPIQTYQQSGIDANKAVYDMSGGNEDLADLAAVLSVPGLALGDVAGAAGGPVTAKAIKEGLEMTIANASKDAVKKKALDHLLNQQLIGTKNIPITKTGGGDVPIPVSVTKSIPVRFAGDSTPRVEMDAWYNKELDTLTKDYTKEMNAAAKKPEIRGTVMAKAIDAKYEQKLADLEAVRASGTIPKKITVKDAPKPKVSMKKDPAPTEDMNLLNIKISKVKDPERKAQLIAERDARLSTKKSPVDHYIPDVADGKSPGVFTRSWRSVAGVLEKNGTGGKAINRGVQNARDHAEKATGNYMTDLEQAGFKKIDDEGFTRVWDAVESGSAKNLTTDERRLAGALVRTMNRIHTSAATDAGMDIGDRGATYLPHWFKEGDKDMAQFFKRNFNQRNSNLENKRVTNEDGYEKSKESIARYIQNASERIGRAKEFGQSDEKLAAMFDVAAREGYDVKQLERYAKTALGDVDYNSTAHKVSGAIRQYEAVTSLQKSAAANIGQQVNTITVAGVKNWAKATYKYWSDPNARDWAKRTGVFGDHVLGNLQKQYAGSVGDNLTGNKAVQIFKKHFLVPGMQAVEKFNRANAVLAGKGFAEDLLKKAAKGDKKSQRLLQQYFPGIKDGDEVTEDMITNAARELVKRTQFKVDPVDLPNWTSGPVGKLIFQFRSFGYKQTQFMAREVIGEALKGNFAPMARFVAIGTPVGYGIAEARNALSGSFMDEEKKKEFADKPWYQRAIEGFSQIGGGGMPLSEATNIKRSVDYADQNNKVLDAATSVLGPAITDARRAADGLNTGLTKGDWKDSAVFAAQQIPILGPVASNLVKSAMTGETKNPGQMNPDELDKYKKTNYAKFVGSMNAKDKDLMEAVSDDDYARLGIKSGKFTQDQIDDMQARWNREQFKAGLPIKYVKGITDEEFNGLTDELKGLVMEASMVGIKKFAESKDYDKTAEGVMKKAMENAWPEVGDIKGSNQLALDYLKAQRDYAEAGKNGDDGKQFDVVKAFWGKAIKEQYPEKVRNLYNNSLADIKRLYEGITVNGVKYEISRADMDAAVALDDRLLKSGLKDTPKFSNKTRAAFGYGEAPTSKVDGVGYAGKKTSSGSGSGRTSGTKMVNPYANALKRGSRSTLSGAVKSSASGGKASVKLAGATGGGGVAKPKVSIKKSKV